MIEQQGRVVRTRGDVAWVVPDDDAACGSCQGKRGCGARIFGELFSRRPVEIAVNNPLHARPDEKVIIGIQEATLVKASFLQYIVPLLSMLLMAAAGEFLASQWAPERTEIASLFGGLAGIFLGLWWVRYRTQHTDRHTLQAPVIVKRGTGGEIPLTWNTDR